MTLAGNATIGGGMVIGGNFHSNVPGHAPVAGSNLGLIIDFWLPTHQDGLGLQSGGPWLKYDNQFDIYYDSGTALTDSLHLDNSGNMTLASGITVLDNSAKQNWIEAREYFPYLTSGTTGGGKVNIWDFLSSNNYDDPDYYLNPSVGAQIRFTDLGADAGYTYIYGAEFADSPIAPAVVCSHHLIVRKDFLVRGQIESYEGVITLYGGSEYETYGPSPYNPFIWLANGGDYGPYNTLEIRETVNGTWGWGNLSLGSLSAQGSVIINGSSTGGTLGNQYGYLSNTGSGSINGFTGNVPVSLTTSYRIICGAEIDVYSDERDKNLIDALNAQTALSAIMKLTPLHFAWKPETQKGDNVVAGFFAQEVAKAIPEAVIVYEGERYTDEHTLNYNVLTTYALSAIQGLATKVDDLTLQIQELTRAGAS